jgi:hypothetical protein
MLLSLLLIAGLARRGVVKTLRNVMLIVAMLSVLITVASFVSPERVSALTEKYVDAFAALTGADVMDDWSANARALQIATVTPWVEQHLLMGTGTISNRWNDGYKGMFEYLHPSDLGFLGIVFLYGVLGLVFFTIQYYFAWRTISALVTKRSDTSAQALLLGCCGCLTILLLSAVTTGSISFNAEQIFFFMVLIQAGVHLKTRNHD